MRFLKGHELIVEHFRYGEGKVVQTYKVNGVWWYEVRINQNLVVHTPKLEWKLKDFSI